MMNITKSALYAALALAAMIAIFDGAPATAQQATTGLRGAAALDESGEAPRIPATEETESRRVRAYPEQPPTIPHKIDGYQLDKNGNKCLSCHARSRTAESGAPMISVTHFMDREGQFLATISPRRYFCNQCHVVQTETAPLVGNTFIDIDSLLASGTAQ